MNNIMSITGFCLNYCDDYRPDNFDMFVIFNEGWGIPSDALLKNVDDAIMLYISETDFGEMDDIQIEIKVMDLFDTVVEKLGCENWGCQCYIRSRR